MDNTDRATLPEGKVTARLCTEDQLECLNDPERGDEDYWKLVGRRIRVHWENKYPGRQG